jgi:hypothetical protein
MTQLFSLPSIVLAEIFKGFLCFKDFSNLDEALQTSSSRNLHINVLHKIKKSPVTFYNCLHFSTDLYVWLKSRHIFLMPNILIVNIASADILKVAATLSGNHSFDRNALTVPARNFSLVLRSTVCMVGVLISFTVQNIRWFSDQLLEALTGKSLTVNLLVLDLTGCSALTDESVVKVAEACTALTTLNLSYLRKITSSSIEKFAALHSLELVNIECSVDREEYLRSDLLALLIGNKALKSVNFRHCGGDLTSTIELLRHKSVNCSNIITLVLNNGDARKVNDYDILNLCFMCPYLEDLTIDHLWCLGVQSIAIIGTHLKSLRILSCFAMSNPDLVASALGEIFDSRTSVDFSRMRMEGKINLDFERFSELLSARISHRRLNLDRPVMDHLILDLQCFMEDGFDEQMLTNHCSTVRCLTVGWFLANLSVRTHMEKLAAACTSLVELSIYNSNVTDRDVAGFALHSNLCLQILRLKECKSVGDRGVSALLDANQLTLIELSIDSCHHNLSDDNLLEHLVRCPKLFKLNVCHQPLVTAEGIVDIVEACGKLRFLTVFRCEGCACKDTVDCCCYVTK